jgi:uncharacterized protein
MKGNHEMRREDYFVKYRVWFIIIPLLITLLMLIPLRKAQINTDLMKYLPEHFPALRDMSAMESEFGKYEPLVLMMDAGDVINPASLSRIQSLSDALNQHPAFSDVISLSTSKYIRGEDGGMLVDPVLRIIPQTAGEKETLRTEIRNNPLVYPLLVSKDFRFSLIVLNPAPGLSDKEIFEALDSILPKHPGPEPILLNGLPYLRNEIQKIAIRDLTILMPLGILIMMLFLWLSFREWKGVLLPLMVVAMSIALAMGLMPLMGWDLSLIAVLVPILMIAIANNYGVHLITRYQELNSKHRQWSMNHIVHESYERLKTPILLTALTTIVGILGMVTHVMLPAQQMGIVSAAGIAFALILSLSMFQAILAKLAKGKPHQSFKGERQEWIDKGLKLAGAWSTRQPSRVLLISILVLLILGSGIIWLRVSFNLENMMPPAHPIRQSTAIANEDFGGTKRINLLFEGDILDPILMREMDSLEQRMERMNEVGDVMSIATVTRIISKSMNDPGDSLYDRIPGSRDMIAQYMEFYNFSGDPEDFEELVNFGYDKAVLSIQFTARDIKEFKKVYERISQEAALAPHCTLMAGQSLVEKEMSEAIIRGQIFSLLFAFASIFIMLTLIFRSLAAGIIGCIPLLVSLACNFGIMGWLGLELDIATSLLSSIAIGIGVDYTIHLFWRFKYELSLGRSREEAAINSISNTGRGITINAISVMIGFAVLFFSGLSILQTFAFLIIFSLLLCLLCAVLLIPAILMLQRKLFNNTPYEMQIVNSDGADSHADFPVAGTDS